MGTLPVGAVIVTILFGSALLGMLVAWRLPNHHLNAETRHVVSVATTVVGTLSALVLGLLISTASGSFGAKTQEVMQISTNVIRMDHLLRRYGVEAQDARALLHRYAAAKLADLFPENRSRQPQPENGATTAMLEELQSKVLALQPPDDPQRWLREQVLELANAMDATSWQLVQESANTTPFPLLALVIFWFILIFASFGLFSPRNSTAIIAILLGSIGVGSAIRMVTELQTPFTGVIRVPNAPLVHALDVIGR